MLSCENSCANTSLYIEGTLSYLDSLRRQEMISQKTARDSEMHVSRCPEAAATPTKLRTACNKSRTHFEKPAELAKAKATAEEAHSAHKRSETSWTLRDSLPPAQIADDADDWDEHLLVS